jgi:hypothetical protein
MRLKKLNKTKTIICANIYDSNHMKDTYTHRKFIDASLQLAEEFPDTFKILEFSFSIVVIATTDLEHCFKLYKHNEQKVTA